MPAPDLKYILKKYEPSWISLMSQWLRLHTTNARGLGLIPGLGTRPYLLQLRPSTAK